MEDHKYFLKLKPNFFKVFIFIVIITAQLLTLFSITHNIFDLTKKENVLLIQIIINIFFLLIFFLPSEEDTTSEKFVIIFSWGFVSVIYTIIFIPTQILFNNFLPIQGQNVIIWLNIIIWVILIVKDTEEEIRKSKDHFSYSSILFSSIWVVFGIIQIFLLIPSLKQYFKSFQEIIFIEHLFTIRSLLGVFAAFFIIISILIRLRTRTKSLPNIPRIKYFINPKLNRNYLIDDVVFSFKYILNVLIKIANPIFQFLIKVFLYVFYLSPILFVEILKEYANLTIYILRSSLFVFLLLLSVNYFSSKSELFYDYLITQTTLESKTYLSSFIYNLIIYIGLIFLIKLLLKIRNDDFDFRKLFFVNIYLVFTATLTGYVFKFITKYELGIIAFYASIIIGLFTLVLVLIDYYNKKKDANKKYT